VRAASSLKARPGALVAALVFAIAALTGPAGCEEAEEPTVSAAADDTAVAAAEGDFTVVTLPTTLPLPRHALAFHMTHRFSRGLGAGDFGDLAADFFGIDGGAQVGLELRFGLTSKAQLGVYRTSDRTIELFLQHEIVRQDGSPVGAALALAVEGLDNFQQDFSPRVGLLVSRRFGDRAALYALPSWVGNTRLPPELPGEDDGTLVIGLGARLRLGETTSLVGELNPRIAGFKGNRGSGDSGTQAAFGIEKRIGGHSFQLNFSNDLGTTPAQTARGRQLDDWFVGFNLTRKFY